MGFIPIFLYLSGFVFLFIMVVANNFKNKKMQYLKAFDQLVLHLKDLNQDSPEQSAHIEKWKLEEVEKYYFSLKTNADPQRLALLDQKAKPYLIQTKRYLYWYNKMIMTKPYSFVAKIMGYSPI